MKQEGKALKGDETLLTLAHLTSPPLFGNPQISCQVNGMREKKKMGPAEKVYWMVCPSFGLTTAHNFIHLVIL